MMPHSILSKPQRMNDYSTMHSMLHSQLDIFPIRYELYHAFARCLGEAEQTLKRR